MVGVLLFERIVMHTHQLAYIKGYKKLLFEFLIRVLRLTFVYLIDIGFELMVIFDR